MVFLQLFSAPIPVMPLWVLEYARVRVLCGIRTIIITRTVWHTRTCARAFAQICGG